MEKTIILDIGGFDTKCGFLKEDSIKTYFNHKIRPSVVIPSVIARRRGGIPSLFPELDPDPCLVGDRAINARGYFNLSTPIEKGVNKDWNDFHKLLIHMFQKELYGEYLMNKVENQEECFLLLSENHRVSSDQRVYSTESLFEYYNFKGLSFQNELPLSLFGCGRTQGVVLESGYETSRSAIVESGFVVSKTYKSLDMGGKELLETLHKIKKDEMGNNFPTYLACRRDYYGYSFFDKVKIDYCFCVSDKFRDMKMEKSLQLPDGSFVKFGDELRSVPETIFNPQSNNRFQHLSYGVHDLIMDSMESYGDIKFLMNNIASNEIIVSGGNSQLNGFAERVEQELIHSPKISFESRKNIKVVGCQERSNQVWRGGCVFASLSSFRKRMVLKEEYDEIGPSVIEKKCPKVIPDEKKDLTERVGYIIRSTIMSCDSGPNSGAIFRMGDNVIIIVPLIFLCRLW